jgi:hypothetical protein
MQKAVPRRNCARRHLSLLTRGRRHLHDLFQVEMGRRAATGGGVNQAAEFCRSVVTAGELCSRVRDLDAVQPRVHKRPLAKLLGDQLSIYGRTDATSIVRRVASQLRQRYGCRC